MKPRSRPRTMRTSACTAQLSTWSMSGLPPAVPTLPTLQLIAESLVDVILRVPEEEQAKLMAHTLAALGDFFLQKSGADDSGSGSTH